MALKPFAQLKMTMLLLPDFNNMAAQAFIDPFRAANYICGNTLVLWDYLSLEGSSIPASNGLVISRTQAFYEVENTYDYVVINASWAPERFQSKTLQRWLRRTAKQGAILIALDTGAFVLGFAGLLKGYQSVVHYEHSEAFRELFPDTEVKQQLFLIDRNVGSCCGGFAAADFALEIIRSEYGFELADATAQYLFMEQRRSGGEEQKSRHHEPVGYRMPVALQEAILLMERNLEEPLRITEISRHLVLSQRQLERLFGQYTGTTPKHYYLNIRLDRARGFLTQTELTIAEIASACGFGSAEQLGRAYKTRFNITPGKDRVEGRIPFQYRSYPQIFRSLDT